MASRVLRDILTQAEQIEIETTNLPKLDEKRVYMMGQASGLRQAANMIKERRSR